MSKLTVKVSLEFLRALVALKVQKGAVIIAGINSQILKLPNLPFTIAALTALNTDLINAIQAALSGNLAAIDLRNQLEAKWITQFRYTANYVSTVSEGDSNFILLCGLDPTSSETTPSLPVTELKNLKTTPVVTPGCAEVSMDKQTNAAGFVVVLAPKAVTVIQKGNVLEICFNGATVYVQPDTHNHFALSGLASGVPLSVYGAAFSLHGTGPLTKSGNDITPQ